MDEIEIRLRKHGYRRGKKGLLDYIRRLETERIPRLEAERDELLAAAADVVGSTLATLEPGDRVLVPGIVIDGIRPKEAAVLEPLVRVSSTTVFGIERRGWYRAADVVGPAPTTPDEGTDTEAWLRGLLADCVEVRDRLRETFKKVATERNETRAALAAAEAERDALAAALTERTHEFTPADDGGCDYWLYGAPCDCKERVPIHQTPTVVRACLTAGTKWSDDRPDEADALSVEATDTEGGGDASA